MFLNGIPMSCVLEESNVSSLIALQNEMANLTLLVLQPEHSSWWRHQMETFSALLAICAGISPVTGEFPTQRPVTRSFDVFCDLCLNKRLRKQWGGWWLRHHGAHYDVTVMITSATDILLDDGKMPLYWYQMSVKVSHMNTERHTFVSWLNP